MLELLSVSKRYIVSYVEMHIWLYLNVYFMGATLSGGARLCQWPFQHNLALDILMKIYWFCESVPHERLQACLKWIKESVLWLCWCIASLFLLWKDFLCILNRIITVKMAAIINMSTRSTVEKSYLVWRTDPCHSSPRHWHWLWRGKM